MVEPARLEHSDQCRLDMRVLDGRQAPKPTHSTPMLRSHVRSPARMIIAAFSTRSAITSSSGCRRAEGRPTVRSGVVPEIERFEKGDSQNRRIGTWEGGMDEAARRRLAGYVQNYGDDTGRVDNVSGLRGCVVASLSRCRISRRSS